MGILCSFKQNGIEGVLSHGEGQLRALTSRVGSGPSTPIFYLPVKSTTATNNL